MAIHAWITVSNIDPFIKAYLPLFTKIDYRSTYFINVWICSISEENINSTCVAILTGYVECSGSIL